MVKSINDVTISGNVTREPELKSVGSGTSIANFSVAVNDPFQNKSGDWEEKTYFIDVIAWSKLGERVASQVVKGQGVVVRGKLTQSSWDDKTTGKKRTKIEVVANEVLSLQKFEKPTQGVSHDILDHDGDEPIDLSEIPF